MSDIVISHEEEFEIYDRINEYRKKTGLAVGWVRAYLHKDPFNLGEPVIDKPNLIVAKGREFVAQKIFDVRVKQDGTNRPNWMNHKVSHFSVGSGGCTIEGQNFTLTGPAIKDTALYQVITLGDETYLEEPSRYSNSTEKPLIHSYMNSVKPINADGSIYLEPVQYEGAPDYYTKVKCTCVVPAGEPTALAPGGSVPISEAGLYFVDSTLGDSDIDKVNMFAHICFPVKYKEKESIFTIYWYILC